MNCSKKRFFIPLLLLIASVGQTHPEETSYFCRGEEFRVKLDPYAVALQTLNPTDKSSRTLGALVDASSEVVYSDPGRGRLAFRTEERDLYEKMSSKIGPGIQVFPVYTSEDGKETLLGFNEINVRLAPDAPADWIDRILEKFQLEIVSQSVYEPDIFELRPTYAAAKTCFELANEVRQEAHFLWVTPNLYTQKLTGTAPAPNDPHFADQVHHAVIDTLGAWDVTQGNPVIRVAVIDGGVDLNHEDLNSRVWINSVEAAGQAGVDDDGNGFVDDINGWDFYDGDNNPAPFNGSGLGPGHGSAVTGLIVAEANNSVGVAGVAPNVKFISCKGFNNDAPASNFDLGEAIRYAANMADIMNNSWASSNPSENILDAIDYAITQGRGGLGCLPIWAAGNGSGDSTKYYARYPWTVGVSLTDYNDVHSDITSFGPTIDIAAPRGQWSTDPTGNVGFNDPELDYVGVFDGSSSAAPIATGVAALILSKNPGLTASEVAMGLVNCVDNPTPSLSDNDFYGKSPTIGYGRVNAHRAVELGTDSINDRLEPNDSILDAAELKSGYYSWLYLPERDVDLYRVKASPNAPMKFILQWMNDWGPINMAVLDSSQRIVATPTLTVQSHITRAEIFFVPTDSEEYFLNVYSQSGPGKAYALQAQVGKQDDAYEPNDTLQQPATLNPGAGTTYKSLVLNNDDYYRIPMNSGEYLYGLVTFNQSRSNLEIQLYSPTGSPLQVSSGDTYGEQFNPYQATTSGDHVLRVFGLNGDLAREYSVHLAVSNTGPILNPGSDDAFEENDTFATATVLNEGFYPNLALDNQGGEVFDAYTFTVPAGKMGRLTMGWNASGTDIDMLIYPEEVLTNPPGTTPPIGKSSRIGVAIEAIALPAQPVDTTYYTEIVRIGDNHQPYRLALEFLDPEPCQIVGLWRFSEGDIGTPCEPISIRDWRGPRMSHAPSLVGSAPAWIKGPDPTFFPGSDGLALDLSGGGLRFDDNGDLSELDLGDNDFTFWARINSQDNSAKRVIAAMPGGWEFSILPDNTLEMTAGSGNTAFNGTGPSVTPDLWQDVAVVWNRTMNQVLVFAANGTTVEQRTASIPGAIPDIGEFHVGSLAGGADALGAMEQVRLFDEALSVDEIRLFSVGFVPSSNPHWELYN
ncbi:MAG: S8 family serine peptidase [Candidatus Omnitrophica bacterium]|nr:S8 family serine peptidase [Candidatus Omnitrophota bacterium]